MFAGGARLLKKAQRRLQTKIDASALAIERASLRLPSVHRNGIHHDGITRLVEWWINA